MRACVSSRFFTSEPLHRLGKGVACLGAAAMLVLSAAMAPLASAQTADGNTGIDASGNAKSEMAACRSGKTAEDRATCMKEARNAQAAKRTGKLQNYGDFSANALERCKVFKAPDDQSACQARVEQARIDGSVAEGGILREARTEVMAPSSSTNTGTSSAPDTPVAPAPGSTMNPGASQTMPETTPPPATQ